MRRQLIIGIGGSFTLSILVVLFLIGVSGVLKDKHNSFLRLFPSHPVLEGNSYDLKVNSYYLAGGTPRHVYLGNYNAPLHILVINTLLTDTQRAVLNVKGIMDVKFWSVRVQVDSPNFYVADGAVPRIYKGSVSSWHADRFKFDNEFFLDMVPMNANSLAVKYLTKQTSESI